MKEEDSNSQHGPISEFEFDENARTISLALPNDMQSGWKMVPLNDCDVRNKNNNIY